MLETFYATTSQISFTLLGLWWVVVQFKHQEWMPHAAYRRMSYDISLYFLLPGIMSLISLLASEENKHLWRIAFGAAGLIGLVETIVVIATAGSGVGVSPVVRFGRWAIALIYALVILLAAFPEAVGSLGIALKPIEVEAIMVALILFTGVNFAWILFAEPVREAPPGM